MSQEFTPNIIYEKFKEKQLEVGASLNLLISMLEHSNDEKLRVAAINFILEICIENEVAQNQNKQILKILENYLLSDESYLVRASAVEALIKLFPNKCMDPLFWILHHETSGHVLNKLAITLSKVEDEGFANLKRLISSNLDKLAKIYSIGREEFFVLLELGIDLNFFNHDRSNSIFGVIYGSDNNFAVNQGHVVALTLRKINFLPETIGSLTHLEHLDVRYNQIPSVPTAIGQLKRLRNLWLCDNYIQTLPDSIGDLNLLQTLRLSSNYLVDMPDGISGLKDLKILELQNNNLKNFPSAIFKIKSLEQLDLSNNQIESIPDSIQHLSNLNALWIKNNKICELPISFAKLRNLKTLDLQENKLNCLPDNFNTLKSLVHLNLRNNAFKDVNDVMKSLKKRELNCLLL